MKVCFSSSGKDLESVLDSHFGRCQYFIVYDTENDEYKTIDNEGQHSEHGAGIAAAQQVIKLDVDVIITGNLGPNSMELLKDSSAEIYRGSNTTISSNLESYKSKSLDKITEPRKPHFGLGNGNKHRGRS